MTTNVILGGVGGQGLVLSTKIIADAVLISGYDLKTTDVIGLAQRGGMVWGTVRFDKEKVHSPNIPKGRGHFMLATEPLEALRWLDVMSKENPKGHIFLNTKEVYPTLVQMEKEVYPNNYLDKLAERCHVTTINAFEKGKEFGTEKLANTFLVGMLASKVELPKENWLESLKDNVPPKFVEQNENAFEYGYNYINTRRYTIVF